MPLPALTLALVRAAIAVARGREDELRQRFAAARAAGVPAQWIEELLLQSFLNVGYPLALVAFGVWREVNGPDVPTGEDLSHDEWERWKERGAEVCGAVYGRTYHKLLVNLRALHPALETLVLIDAYGKLIGRPGLELKLRELCNLAEIAVLDTPRQLHSHLRGALNVGWSPEEVDTVLEVVKPYLESGVLKRVEETWADVRQRGRM
jgi:4-carboxymuconolactone decarboxylase